jgi:predicted transcriptional regulator
MSDRVEVTLSLPSSLMTDLDEIAAAADRSRAEIAEEALAEFVEYQRWKDERIREGLREADAGQTVAHADVFVRLETKIRERTQSCE